MAVPPQFLRLRGESNDTRSQDNINNTLGPLADAVGRTPIMGASAPSWVGIELTGGFTNFGNGLTAAAYHKDALLYVHVKGFLLSAAGCAAFTTLGVLPVGYRPADTHRFPVEGNLSTYQAVQLGNDGRMSPCVAVAAGGYMGLDFSFLAER